MVVDENDRSILVGPPVVLGPRGFVPVVAAAANSDADDPVPAVAPAGGGWTLFPEVEP